MDPATTAITSGASTGNMALVLAGFLLLAVGALWWFIRNQNQQMRDVSQSVKDVSQSVRDALDRGNDVIADMPKALKVAVKEANEAHARQMELLQDAHARETQALHEHNACLLALVERRCPLEGPISELAGHVAVLRGQQDGPRAVQPTRQQA